MPPGPSRGAAAGAAAAAAAAAAAGAAAPAAAGAAARAAAGTAAAVAVLRRGNGSFPSALSTSSSRCCTTEPEAGSTVSVSRTISRSPPFSSATGTVSSQPPRSRSGSTLLSMVCQSALLGPSTMASTSPHQSRKTRQFPRDHRCSYLVLLPLIHRCHCLVVNLGHQSGAKISVRVKYI